jgi:hypothetical protein
VIGKPELIIKSKWFALFICIKHNCNEGDF